MLVLLLLLVLCGSPVVLAASPDLEEQASALGMEELKKAGEAYTGPVQLDESLDLRAAFHHMAREGRQIVQRGIKRSARSCVLLLTVTLLFGLAESMSAGTGGDPIRVSRLAAALSITAVAVGDVHSLLSVGKEAILRMETLGNVLLPTVSMAAAACGTPAAAAAKHGVTIVFSDLLILLIDHVLIPLCNTYVAAQAAWAALGNDGLRRMAGLIKWLIVTMLSAVLLGYISYLHLSGVISGSADAATVKAAKFTISHLVPVVGGVIADTAETLLAGASVLRGAAGVFGMLAVIGICVAPFVHLGIHYLMYKGTAALAATVSGEGRVTGLIEAIGSAFGLILGMTASCAVLLIVAMISAVSAVSG